MNARAFPHALKAWRQSRRRSQLDLALAASVSQRHLSFLESGKAAPSRQMVLQLADALELPLRECNDLLPVLPLVLRIGDTRLSLFTTLTTFGTPLDVTTDELRVESFYPMDEETRAWFRGAQA